MTDPPQRIAPLTPPYEPDVAAMLAKWMPPGAQVEPLALFRTLNRHADLASRARPLGAGILGHGLLEPRLREVMILRTCALTGAEYEWGVHVAAFARPLGFSDEQLRETVDGQPDAAQWAPDELAVLALAGALHERSGVCDDEFAALAAHFSDEEIIELCVIAGWYHAIAYVINVCAVQAEPWAERFAALA
ncbi:MAG TPA: carboxymuconolactone decarboxylase family protein [Solirubrobacteraceae bacterium]|nr:carboxymuconolactone decarboxylase family protein [Solirubrobacteraceae bacterium]